MNTRKTLEAKVKEIATLTNQSTSREEAAKNGHEMYLQLEHNSVYGGYRLVNVKLISGGHYGAFGGNGCEARLSASKMALKLDSIINGVLAAK